MELHWSVDYRSHHKSFDFEKCFSKAIHNSLTIEYPQSYDWCRKKYRILPNYWDGFSTHKENYEDAGSVEVERVRTGHLWEIKGVQENTDSAEITRFHYHTAHGVEGNYACTVENLHQDGYRKLELEGHIGGGNIEVHTGKGLSVIKEKTKDVPVYTNWCLLDRLPEQPFSLMDHLESFYRDISLQYMEDWVYEGQCLRGYVLSGYGSPFSYYWINQQGHVVAAAQTLMTYVLCGAEFERRERI